MDTLIIVTILVNLLLIYRVVSSTIWRAHRFSLNGIKVIFVSSVFCGVLFIFWSVYNFYTLACEGSCRQTMKFILTIYLLSTFVQLQYVDIINKRRVKYNYEDEVDARRENS